MLVEHIMCILPFNKRLNTLWYFIKTPGIKLIIIYQNIYSWNVFDRYTYIQLHLALFSLYTNSCFTFLLSLIVIAYIPYNAWIIHSQYVRTMPIWPPHRMSFLIWPHKQNREWDIDLRHSNSCFLSRDFICTCRA